MLSCKEATVLLSRSQELSLSWTQRLALRMHLLFCDGCTNFRKQLAFIRHAIRQYRDVDTPR